MNEEHVYFLLLLLILAILITANLDCEYNFKLKLMKAMKKHKKHKKHKKPYNHHDHNKIYDHYCPTQAACCGSVTAACANAL